MKTDERRRGPAPRPPLTREPAELTEPGRRRHPTYYREVDRFYRYAVPPGARVLELGCGTGRLLAALAPSYGLGVDKDPERVAAGRRLHADRPELELVVGDAETIDWASYEPFDYVLLSGLVALLVDVQQTLARLHPVCHNGTRLIIDLSSNLWRPLLAVAGLMGYREQVPDHNWLSVADMSGLLNLAGFELITYTGRILVPVDVPGVSVLFNRLLAKLPGIDNACLTWFLTARPAPKPRPLTGAKAPTVSVVVPTLNERGNIKEAFTRTPRMGKWTELVFIDGGSNDGTREEIELCRERYRNEWPRVTALEQTGKGKGQAVRQAFGVCHGDILMILDSDLTMPPEELPKYYEAIVSGRGELINGCRLVYKVEHDSMRFLNMIANRLFGMLFTYLFGQPVRDTLCGTKVLWRHDYEVIAANRAYFGEFDPFGDFDLLFGAARLSQKILDLPIRYRPRTYGDIKIQRWRHGVLLAGMSAIGFNKLKVGS